MRCLPLIVLAASILVASAAVAQDRAPAARPKAPPTRSWAKLCETPTAGSSDLFGKPSVAGVKTCVIHHEQLDGTSGTVRVAAGVQQAEGQQTLMIRVPAGADREPGVRLMILPRDVWQKVQSNQQVPLPQSDRVRRLTLTYSLCNLDGCIAETKASTELVADLKSGGGLVIVTLKARHAFAYLVTLGGFREAYDGPPVDSSRYRAARAELLRQIRERQKQGLQPPRRPGDGQGVPGVPGAPGVPSAPPPRPGGGQDI